MHIIESHWVLSSRDSIAWVSWRIIEHSRAHRPTLMAGSCFNKLNFQRSSRTFSQTPPQGLPPLKHLPPHINTSPLRTLEFLDVHRLVLVFPTILETLNPCAREKKPNFPRRSQLETRESGRHLEVENRECRARERRNWRTKKVRSLEG